MTLVVSMTLLQNDERKDSNCYRSQQRDREGDHCGHREARGPRDNGVSRPEPRRGGGPGGPARDRGRELSGGGQTPGPGLAAVRPLVL